MIDPVTRSARGNLGVVVVVVAVAAVVGFVTRPRPTRWCTGIIERGSIVESSSGVRFTLRHGWPTSPMFVRYDGVLPDTVCSGSEVAVEGWLDGARFEGIQVVGGGQSKYDPCRRTHCRPDAEKPPRCRRGALYE